MPAATPVADPTDATRREFPALLAAAGLLPGCAGGDAPAAAPTGPATRSVSTPRGPVTVPADPQRVIAVHTHDLANALALGLPVIAGPGGSRQPGSGYPPYLVDRRPDVIAPVVSYRYSEGEEYRIVVERALLG